MRCDDDDDDHSALDPSPPVRSAISPRLRLALAPEEMEDEEAEVEDAVGGMGRFSQHKMCIVFKVSMDWR